VKGRQRERCPHVGRMHQSEESKFERPLALRMSEATAPSHRFAASKDDEGSLTIRYDRYLNRCNNLQRYKSSS